MTMLRWWMFLLLAVVPAAAQRAVYAPDAPKPIGPYTPGIVAGDYLYVSGQGALDAKGNTPPGFEAKARLTLDNVKAIVEAAGLKLDRVLYTQCFLDDLANLDTFDRIWREYFPGKGPVRIVVGVARMPAATPVEVNAVAALRDTRRRYGRRGSAFEQWFYTAPPPPEGRVATRVAALPGGAKVAVTGVSELEPGTFYAIAASVLPPDRPIEDHVRSAMDAIVKQVGSARVVASTVFLDDIGEFSRMNAVYARYFPEMPPARTTLQPAPAGSGAPKFQATVVAVK